MDDKYFIGELVIGTLGYLAYVGYLLKRPPKSIQRTKPNELETTVE